MSIGYSECHSYLCSVLFSGRRLSSASIVLAAERSNITSPRLRVNHMQLNSLLIEQVFDQVKDKPAFKQRPMQWRIPIYQRLQHHRHGRYACARSVTTVTCWCQQSRLSRFLLSLRLTRPRSKRNQYLTQTPCDDPAEVSLSPGRLLAATANPRQRVSARPTSQWKFAAAVASTAHTSQATP
jgi:hypothetical protein